MPAIVDKIAEALHMKKREAEEKVHQEEVKAKATTSTTAKPPVFDPSKVTVVFVLGGPGAGKGTQSEKLVEEFGFCHLSAGDLLREEQHREGSQYGELIRTYIKEGTIVPMEVTIKLLENAMTHAFKEGRSGAGWAEGRGRFLVDGFPRKMDQAIKFEEDVCPSALTLFFTTTEEEMTKRLLERGKTSGREDDNVESIVKRFRTYKETTMPVIEHFNKQGKVAEIDSSPPIDEVYAKTREIVEKLFAGEVTRNVTV